MEKQRRHATTTLSQFNLEGELRKHAWFSQMTAEAAEKLLSGSATYTYLLRKGQAKLRKYEISYVGADGLVHHDTFTLINPKLGIWRNGRFCHVGKLQKVVCDMMHCQLVEAKPFAG